MQKPSIGRIVHYTNLGDKDGKFPPEVQAAIITGVYFVNTSNTTPYPTPDQVAPDNTLPDGKIRDRAMYADIRVLYRTGEFNMVKCPFSEAPERGHWNWPPRD